MEKNISEQDRTNLNRRKKYILTAAIYLGYFTLGIGVSVNGACLIDLAAVTKSTVGDISWIFTGLALGGILGAFLVPVVARKCVLFVPIGLALLMNGLVYVVLPWCPHFSLMIAVMFFFGMGKCFIDASFTFTLVDTWRLENAPWMQGLHFMYGVGSMLGPLIAKPFITAGHEDIPKTQQNLTLPTNITYTLGDHSNNKQARNVAENLQSEALHLSVATVTKGYDWEHLNNSVKLITSEGFNNTQASPSYTSGSTMHYAYLISAALFFTSAAVFITVGAVYRFSWGFKARRCNDKRRLENYESSILPRTYKVLIIGSLFFLSFAGLLVEHSVVLFLFTFAVMEVHWTKDAAVMLMFVFLLAYTLGRGFCALIACCLKPKHILISSIFLVVSSSSILWVAYEVHPAVVWVCMTGIGAGIGPFFAPSITYFNNFHPITPFVGGMTQLASALSALIAPSISGFFYEHIGPVSLVYILFTGGVMLVIFFLSLVYSGHKIKQYKSGDQKAEELSVGLNEKA